MARGAKGCTWTRTFNSRTGTFVNTCKKRRRVSKRGLLGDIGSLPTSLGEGASLKSMIGDVKGVVINGGVAVAGAVLSDKIFTYIIESVDKEGKISGVKRHLAEMAVGVGLGLIVGKLLKKPRIAVLVAIGPVVVGGLKIVGEMLNSGPFAGRMAGTMAGVNPMGMMAIEPYRGSVSGYQLPQAQQPALNGMVQVGPGTPGWMTNQEPMSDAAFMGY